jgi:hypothetical protein
LWIYLDLVRQELQAMTAGECKIIFTRAPSVAALQSIPFASDGAPSDFGSGQLQAAPFAAWFRRCEIR